MNVKPTPGPARVAIVTIGPPAPWRPSARPQATTDVERIAVVAIDFYPLMPVSKPEQITTRRSAMEIDSEPAKAVFNHPENITFGKARLIWAEETTADAAGRGVDRPAGWVMPGGRRIVDRGHALEVVAGMDFLSKR